VLLLRPPSAGNAGDVEDPLAGVVANNAGVYTVHVPPRAYVPIVFGSNYVFNYVASPVLTLAAGQTITTNLMLAALPNATPSISGHVVDANNDSNGLPGIIELAESSTGLTAVTFSDTNGQFNLPVTSGEWTLGGTDLGLIVHGYVGSENGTNVTAGATEVTLAYSKATALFYGSVKDNLGNPLPDVELQSEDNNKLYYTEVRPDSNGDYVIVALGGLTNDQWEVELEYDYAPINYIFSYPDVDLDGGTNLSTGQAVLVNFTAMNSGLVLNGGFETGNFTDWTSSGDTSNTSVDHDAAFFGITPYFGRYEAALGTSGSLGYLSQTLSTTAGASYLLSFWFENPDPDPGEFLVSWNGGTILDTTNLDANNWTNMQFVVSATGTNTVLQFGFEDDYNNFGLDDISVMPESTVLPTKPGIASLRLSGTNLVLNGINGQAGGTYYVLMSTNLGLPLHQWTPVATNILSASGNFTITVTNTLTPTVPQRFYILETQ